MSSSAYCARNSRPPPPDQITTSRAFAYGGSVIQDLGYYPFGSHFFTNVLHYVRSGDFVEAMLGDSQSLEEYAFALARSRTTRPTRLDIRSRSIGRCR